MSEITNEIQNTLYKENLETFRKSIEEHIRVFRLSPVPSKNARIAVHNIEDGLRWIDKAIKEFE